MTDGTVDFNATQYRISVYYDLAKVAVNRLAFSEGHECAPYGATAVAVTPGWLRSEMMLDNFGVTEDTWRDALTGSVAGFPCSPRGIQGIRVASICRSRHRGARRRSRPGEVESALRDLRRARPRVRLHRCRRLSAR